DGFSVELFLNGNVRHGRGCRGAVPVLLTRREPDHVTGPDFLDRAAPALGQAAASRHDQGLAQRVGVPRRPSAGLERDTGCSSWYILSMKTAKSAPVLDQLMAPLGDCLTPESARRLLALKADPKLQARVDDLAGRHSRGALTPEEQAEY